jgi:leader peptidase (prepilin peptidase) / N-methyltransferase
MESTQHVLQAFLLFVLISIAVIDARRGIIPDWSNALVLFVGLVGAALGHGPSLKHAIFSVACTLLIFLALRAAFFHWRGQAALGLGDVKFLAAAAAWTGISGLPPLVLVASLSGLLYLLARALLGVSVTNQTRLAFGPHLALGLGFVSIFAPP